MTSPVVGKTKFANARKFAQRGSKRWYESRFNHQMAVTLGMQIAIFESDSQLAKAVYCSRAGATQFQAAVAMGMRSADAMPRILERMEKRYGFSADQVLFTPRDRLHLGAFEAGMGAHEMLRELRKARDDYERAGD